MPRKKLTHEQKEAVRNRIADYGHSYAARRGVFPTCQQIADVVGISRMGLYLYFASKQQRDEAMAALILKEQNPHPKAVLAICNLPLNSVIAPEIARRFYNNYLPEEADVQATKT